MVLWNGLGQVGTIAQLTGLDAFGLTLMILNAVQMVRRKKKACKQLVQRIQMIADLLETMQGSPIMQRPETRRPLEGLEDTLRRAYVLISSCKNCSCFYLFFMGEKLTNQFSEVQNNIDFYLMLFPILSHIDTTCLLERFLGDVHPPQQQAAPKLLRSFVNHTNPDDLKEIHSGLEIFQAVTEPFRVTESHVGAQNVVGALQTRKRRMRWPCKETKTTPALYTGSLDIKEQGLLRDGHEAAIKLCFKESTKLEIQDSDFNKEMQSLSKLQHTNIIKLLGYCCRGREKILVYEYMMNGSLESFFSGLETAESMNWSIRYKIIEGIAMGIVYLHKQCRLRIIHCDLKPRSILLDSDMNPRISNFGFAKILNPGANEVFEESVFGTPGFIAPESLEEGFFSVQSDVYSFGALLLQIINGKRLCSQSSGPGDYGSLNTRVWDLWKDGNVVDFIDPLLRKRSFADATKMGIVRCIQIALLCVQHNRADRPAIWDVVLMLSCEGATLPVPNSLLTTKEMTLAKIRVR